MKSQNKIKILLITFLCVFALYAITILPTVLSWGPLNNYRNFSVKTTVNVTESMPEIMNITCNSGNSVLLMPGGQQNVTCVIQLRDFNGGNTINGTGGSGVNASYFYYFLNKSDDPDDNNVHYTNNSCTLNGTDNGWYINWTCSFMPWYYANNGSWFINVSVHDRYHSTSYNVSGTGNFTISALYAINVTDTINFGDMAVGDTSANPIQANITNFGNMRLNITVYGFGGENRTLYANYSMICDQRNLTSNVERYSINQSDLWSGMTPINNTAVTIQAFNIVQRTNDLEPVVNSTYWRLYIDPASNPYGTCNGTVVFGASAG
jgi:hypothetical protein